MVVVGAWMLKLAVADAWSLAATLLAYHRTTLEMTPDPEWVARLEGMSDQFQELGRKAREAVETRTAPAEKGPGAPTGASDEAAAPSRGARVGGDAVPDGATAATLAAVAAAVDGDDPPADSEDAERRSPRDASDPYAAPSDDADPRRDA